MDSLLIIFDEAETVAEEDSNAMDVETPDSPTNDAKGKEEKTSIEAKTAEVEDNSVDISRKMSTMKMV